MNHQTCEESSNTSVGRGILDTVGRLLGAALSRGTLLATIGAFLLASGCQRQEPAETEEPQTLSESPDVAVSAPSKSEAAPPGEELSTGARETATSASTEPSESTAITATPEIPNPMNPEMQPQVLELLEQRRADLVAAPMSLDAWLGLGIACDAHKLYQCAETCYRRGLELSPDHFKCTYFLAFILDASGNTGDDALESYRAAIKIRPNYVPTYCWLGRSLDMRGKPEEALDAYIDALVVDPDSAYAHRGAGQVLLSLGEGESALTHLEQAVALSPGDFGMMSALESAYRRLGKPTKFASSALPGTQPARQFHLPDVVRDEVRNTAIDSVTLLEQAKVLIHASQFEAAIPKLKIVETATPDNPFVHVFLGTCLRRTGQRLLAAVHLKKAVRLRESSASAHFELAILLIEFGRLEEGLHHYERAATYSTSPRDTHIWVGAALVRSGFPEAADSAFEQATELGPLDAKTEALWGSAMYKMGDFVAAAQHFKRSTLLDPRTANVYYDLALSLERSEQFSEAIIQYRKAVRLDPDHDAAVRLARLEAEEP